MSNQAVAGWLAEKQVHIAVDLNGYTADARPEIFVQRPVPIQVNYLGYPCTMGTDFMDYILVDPHIVPADQQPNFSERLVHLPDSYLVTDSKRTMTKKSPSRRDVGLPEDGFVFCCFHNSYKITPVNFDIWMRLLTGVPNSVLWLRADNEIAIRNLRKEAAARDVEPERIVLADRLDMADHLARHCLADLFLDTLPYNAHSSASDALWAGLPMLTCMGQAFAGRVGASLLHAIGLPELVTHSLEDYEALAIKLANEPDFLSEIRTRLASNRDTQPLFDCARFCRHLESAYETMVDTWQDGNPPAPIKVDPIV
jgi:predicted O-linked N-acetylglucosamine transferase (SPINDLY family)